MQSLGACVPARLPSNVAPALCSDGDGNTLSGWGSLRNVVAGVLLLASGVSLIPSVNNLTRRQQITWILFTMESAQYAGDASLHDGCVAQTGVF